MSDKQETIADIIAEMQSLGKRWLNNGRGPGLVVINYADRLEAAHERELAERGDAAKLREAIDKCVNLITEFGNAEIVKTPLDVIIDIEAILKAALAEVREGGVK